MARIKINNEKIVIQAILKFCRKKCQSLSAAAEKINYIECQGFISKSQAVEWFCRFREGDISLKDKSRSGRLKALNDEVLCQPVKQLPGSSIQRFFQKKLGIYMEYIFCIYSPDIAPSDFYLFHSNAHFLCGRHLYKIIEVKDSVWDFLASKPPE